ncbi:hypothetical protein [Thermosipho atlanticus]|uniref:Uncharacterized protein n=1 Tax=Thermosipho atlanticus DSM 15807 TaxID=1123380 RepID=A0A1M5SMG8_9BACT|nr:hypothetical protein [Thermosipho atlanticus]SHH39468.1 hypothetical protein SAMN02745199_0948 [Thermosipho atlanticus DSM 15807]
MEKLIEILKEIFNPLKIFKSNEIITVVINNDQNMEEKLKHFSKQVSSIEEEFSFRFLTTEELKKLEAKELGVRIY